MAESSATEVVVKKLPHIMMVSQDSYKAGLKQAFRRARSQPTASVHVPAPRKPPRREHSLPGSRRAFSLLELLVVIAIIALLVGVASPVTIAALNKAKVVKCKQQIASLTMALNSYKAEYGYYPLLKIRGEVVSYDYGHGTGENSRGNAFLRCMMGEQYPNGQAVPPKNPRGIQFFSPKNTKTGKTGLYHPTGSWDYAYADPWGRAFQISYDYTGDGWSFAGKNWNGWKPLDDIIWQQAPFIIMSLGKDVLDPADNVCSWK